MKSMKKIVSVVLALIMVMGMSTTVFAADEYTITINNEATGHTYEAYQIFTGDLSGSTLSNIEWGNGLSDDGKTGVAKDVAEGIKNQADAEAFAAAKAPYLQNPIESTYIEGTGYQITVTAAGYYLIKDKKDTVPAGDAYTEYILKVVKDTSVNAKSDKTTVTKEVADVNDSTAPDEVWGESADYDIGDNVPFKLTATLGQNVSRFDTYKVVFNDTLSEGLTYDDNAKVYIGTTEVTNSFGISHENGVLTVSCNDVKALGATDGSVITVEYTATLNDKAEIGNPGNENKVYLNYSNNPNAGGSGEMGKTPDDKVVVFTYKLVANKVAQDTNQPLVGAGFTLYKEIGGSYVAVGEEITGPELTTFEWKGLDDGKYKLVETTTPAGYNTIKPIEFTISAEHSVDEVTSLTAAGFTPDLAAGSLTTDVVNNPGSTLPETGGMGTTIIYIAGAMLILGAGAALVMRRRRAEEN